MTLMMKYMGRSTLFQGWVCEFGRANEMRACRNGYQGPHHIGCVCLDKLCVQNARDR
jgi:hypothetical protein